MTIKIIYTSEKQRRISNPITAYDVLNFAAGFTGLVAFMAILAALYIITSY